MAITTLIYTESDSWTVPAGVTSINIEAWGGGGGGYSTLLEGSGGGGSGYFRMDGYSVFENLIIVITIGLGGTGGKGGGDGTNTTFLDDYYSSTSYARGGSGTGGPSIGGSYMIDGDHQANCIFHMGTDGGDGALGNSFAGYGGGGGEAAGSDGADAIKGQTAEGSVGGSNIYTGGDGGNGDTLSTEGSPGNFPGGGGGQNYDGANGMLIITYGGEEKVITAGFAAAGNYCF